MPVLGKAKVQELASSVPVADASNSDFPVKMREAFLLLTGTVTGTNSVIPIPGPLVAALVSFL